MLAVACGCRLQSSHPNADVQALRPADSRSASAVDQMAHDDGARVKAKLDAQRSEPARPRPPHADYRRGSRVVDQPSGVR